MQSHGRIVFTLCFALAASACSPLGKSKQNKVSIDREIVDDKEGMGPLHAPDEKHVVGSDTDTRPPEGVDPTWEEGGVSIEDEGKIPPKNPADETSLASGGAGTAGEELLPREGELPTGAEENEAAGEEVVDAAEPGGSGGIPGEQPGSGGMDHSNDKPAVPAPRPGSHSTASTYDEAMIEIDEYRRDVSSFKGGTGAGEEFWVGDGVNALDGERKLTCLDIVSLRKRITKIKQTKDHFDFVRDYLHLYDRTETDAGGGANFTYNSFTFGAKVRNIRTKEIEITNEGISAVAAFTHLRERHSIYNISPSYSPYFANLIANNRGLFRRLCGDAYTKSVDIGGAMHLTFSAKKKNSNRYQKNVVQSSFRVGLAGLFGAGGHFNMTKENQEILKNYSVEMKCFTSGVLSNVCADFELNTTFNFDNDGKDLSDRINKARKAMAKSIDIAQTSDLVVVGEELQDYEVPLSQCVNGGVDDGCPKKESIFYDYRPRVKKSNTIFRTLLEVQDLCAAATYWPNRCHHVREQFREALVSCASNTGVCEDVKDRSQIDMLRSVANPGNFTIWKDTWRRGDVWRLDLNGGDVSGNWLTNTFYIFKEMGWDKIRNKSSSIEARVNPGFMLRFWDKSDGSARGDRYDLHAGDHFIANLQNWNDRISSFEIIPVPDL